MFFIIHSYSTMTNAELEIFHIIAALMCTITIATIEACKQSLLKKVLINKGMKQIVALNY